MAIEVVFITVVTRMDDIEERYPGGFKAYSEMPFVWTDGLVIGSSFMNVMDVETHLKHLERYGFTIGNLGRKGNAAVVDQLSGLLTECEWLNFGRPDGYSVCWLKGEEPGIAVGPSELSG